MSLIKTNKKGEFLPSFVTDFFDTDRFLTPGWFPTGIETTIPSVNIKENGSGFQIELAAPGFKKTDFKINLEDDVLTISAEKKEEKEEENERFTRQEYSYSSFSRSFTLPASADSEKVNAKYTDGILSLTIPKKEEAQVQSKKEIKVG